MKINKLILENIKCYTYKEYDFSDGLNFITGKNGNGKTTIIEAIGFAMFNYKIVGKNFSTYFVNIASSKKTGKVKVYFTDKNEEEYLVERVISETASKNIWTVKNIESGEVVAEKDLEVILFIKDHIDISTHLDISNQFENIISVPQGKYVEGFDRSDEERKKLFDPIFNLDIYKKAATKIQIKKEVEEKINKLRVLEGKAEVKIEALKESIVEESKLEEEVSDLEILLEKTEKEKNELEEYIVAQEKMQKDILSLESKAENLNLSLNSTKKELEKNNIDILEAKEATKICIENKEKYLGYIKLEEEVNILEKDVEILKEKEVQKDKENSNLKILENTYNITLEKIKDITENIIQIKNTLKEDEKVKTKMKNSLKKVKEEKAALSVSDSVEEINNIFLAIKIKKSNSELQSKLLDFKNIEEEKEKEEQLLEQYKDINTEKENCNIEIKALEEKIENEKENISLMKKGICPITKSECITIVSKVTEKEKSLIKLEEEKNKKDLTLQSILDKIKDSDKIKAKIIEIDKKLNDKYIIKSKLEKEDNAYIGCSIEDLEKRKLELEEQEKEKRTKETSIASKISSLETEIRNIDKQEEKENKNIFEKEKIIQEEKFEIQKLEENKKDIIVCIKDIEDYISKNINVKNSLENLKKEREVFKLAYNEYIKNEVCANKLEEYLKLELDIKREIENINKDITNINENIKENKTNLNLTKLEESKNKEKEIISSLVQVQVELNKKLEVEKINKENIKKLSSLNINKDKVIHNMEVYKKVISEIENYQAILKSISTNIAIILLDQISTEANKIYTKIMQDGTFLRWGDKYELTVTEKLGETVIVKQFKQLSGGEQMSASIAIRLAMIQRLSNVKLGILDEPSINLDEEKRERLAEVINEFKEICNQLFIVSHDSTFDDYIDYQIEVSK